MSIIFDLNIELWTFCAIRHLFILKTNEKFTNQELSVYRNAFKMVLFNSWFHLSKV